MPTCGTDEGAAKGRTPLGGDAEVQECLGLGRGHGEGEGGGGTRGLAGDRIGELGEGLGVGGPGELGHNHLVCHHLDRDELVAHEHGGFLGVGVGLDGELYIAIRVVAAGEGECVHLEEEGRVEHDFLTVRGRRDVAIHQIGDVTDDDFGPRTGLCGCLEGLGQRGIRGGLFRVVGGTVGDFLRFAEGDRVATVDGAPTNERPLDGVRRLELVPVAVLPDFDLTPRIVRDQLLDGLVRLANIRLGVTHEAIDAKPFRARVTGHIKGLGGVRQGHGAGHVTQIGHLTFRGHAEGGLEQRLQLFRNGDAGGFHEGLSLLLGRLGLDGPPQ